MVELSEGQSFTAPSAKEKKMKPDISLKREWGRKRTNIPGFELFEITVFFNNRFVGYAFLSASLKFVQISLSCADIEHMNGFKKNDLFFSRYLVKYAS